MGVDTILRRRVSPVVFTSRLPFDERRVQAAAIYCSDGRFGEQMDEFLHSGLRLPRYDRVAAPGGAACLAGHAMTYYEQTAMESQVEFLVREHGLRRIVLIAHDGCAFYKSLWHGLDSVEEQQASDLRKAVERITLWQPGLKIEAYFARKVDGQIAFERWSSGNGDDVAGQRKDRWAIS